MLFGEILVNSVNLIAQQGGAMNWLTEKYVAGGIFMHPILACLIIGLAFSIERFWTLTRSSINTKNFIVKVKEALKTGGVESAKELCMNTRGPVASVFYAGLLRADEGLESVEKAVMAYGAIEMGFLEKGLIWINTCISLAPMLGFTGTVQGMIESFDAIAAANQISPSIVATGIAVALLTTLFGLVVAMILQTIYNYFVSRIDGLVADMEESSIELIDALYEIKSK